MWNLCYSDIDEQLLLPEAQDLRSTYRPMYLLYAVLPTALGALESNTDSSYSRNKEARRVAINFQQFGPASKLRSPDRLFQRRLKL